MTRHFFRFNLFGGGVTVLTTTDEGEAKKVVEFRATAAGAYFTPWMSPLVQNAQGGAVPDETSLARVNLLQVTAMDYERREE